MSPIDVEIQTGFRGYVNGLLKSGRLHRVKIEAVGKDDNRHLFSDTFEGSGENKYLESIRDGRTFFSFGPFQHDVIFKITIKNKDGKDWKDSKIVGPFKLHKEQENDFPMEVHQTTIISEDGGDQDYNDCTVVIIQYKGDAAPKEKK